MNDQLTPLERLPDESQSYWRQSAQLPSYPRLDSDIDVDVAVVGAGIAGITTAYLLAEEGLNVALLDASSVISGTTGYTTAKVSAQHGLIYDQLLKVFGEEQALAYFHANRDAAARIRSLSESLGIDCDWKTETAYVYASDSSGLKQLEKEWKAYEKLGLPGEHVNSIGLPLETKGAIAMAGQAQFHPVRYLQGLLTVLGGKGAHIYEHTKVTELNTDNRERPRLTTGNGHRVTARHVVVASHFPFCDKIGLYYARLHAERSYVVAIRPQETYPGGMYISADEPKRSLRTADSASGPLVLVGGENHKTGENISTVERYVQLELFGSRLFGIEKVPFRWSAQDLITLDKVPYIGPITDKHPNVHVATGFGKWGMTNGTAAAGLIRDHILERDNPYAELFKPSRFHAGKDVKSFVVQNAGVAKSLVTGKLEPIHVIPGELEPGQGSVVNVEGKRCGAYRDEEGGYHIVDTTCTHMGCELEWNDGERSWDCPCHGSRFAVNGEVLEGPAVKPLKTIQWPEGSGGILE